MKTSAKTLNRTRRHARIRARVSGTEVMPRLSVFKSNTAVYAQLIDDASGKTLAAASTKTASGKTMMEKAGAVGKAVADAAKGKGIAKAVFDRGGFIYTGLVKAVADGAREGGLSM